MLTLALVALALVGVVVALAVASGVISWPVVGGPLAVSPSPSPTAAAVTGSPTPAAPTLTATLSPTPAVATPAPAEPSVAAPATPTPVPTPRIHIVQAGESLVAIGALYELPWQLIAQANDIENASRIYVGQELLIPQPGEQPLGRIHYVQRGETINQIAALYGVTPAELAEANGLEDLNTIYVGQLLIVPGR
jgi:LysM repeat protein